MDHETQRKKRQEELEAKRKRLEEMRKMRKTRTADAPSDQPETASPTPTSEHESVDELVNSLLTNLPPPSGGAEVIDTQTVVANVAPPPTPLSRVEIARQRAAELTTVSNVIKIDIAPVIIETYHKECQTDEVLGDENARDDDTQHTPHRRARADSSNHIPVSPPPHGTPSSPARERAKSVDAESLVEEMKSLSPDEITSIMAGENFRGFLSKSSHIMDRAIGLSNAVDIFKDYTGADQAQTDDRNAIMLNSRTFTNKTINGRPIMDVQANPHHAELFLVAYGSTNHSTDFAQKGLTASQSHKVEEGGGLVCIWSVILEEVPEFTFTSHSPVLSARFHPGDPHLIIGGCYSGQIVMWDTRVASARPTMRSNFAGKGHKHPIYSMVIERSNRSTALLITASTDGTLCQWDMANLAEPISTSNLMGVSSTISLSSSSETSGGTTAGSGTARRPICASCMTLGPVEDHRKLIIGSEGGGLSVFTLPFKATAPFQQVAAHFGMITSVHVNPSVSKQFKHLALTASVDWSIKLWDISDVSPSCTPLLEFTASTFEYFSSVRWSHINPAVFSCITSGGILMLWNICQSVVEPVGSLKVNTGDKHSESAGGVTSVIPSIGCALNKSIWMEDGRKALVGDSRGHISLVSVRPTAVSLRAGDEERLESALQISSAKISSISSGLISAPTSAAGLQHKNDKRKPEEGEYKR